MTDLSFLIDTSAPLLVLMFCFHLSVSSQFCLTWVQKLSVSLRLLLNAYGIMIIIIYLTPETPPGKPASQSEHLWFTLIFTAFHLWPLLLMVVRTASMSCLRPNLFQHTWKQTCDPEVTGGQAVLLLLSATLGEKAEQEHVSSLNSSASYIS